MQIHVASLVGDIFVGMGFSRSDAQNANSQAATEQDELCAFN